MRFQLAMVLFTVVCACGDDTNKLADAGPGSGSGIDAPIGGDPVQMTVIVDGAPAAGVEVYFVNADQSLVKTAMTGTDGTASANMASGGSVTVIEPQAPPSGVRPLVTPTEFVLDSFLAVKQGDKLTDFISGPADTTPTNITFNMTIPIDATAGVATYDVDTTCGATSAAITVGSGSGSGSGSGAQLKHKVIAAVGNNAPVAITLADCNGTADMVIVTRDANGIVLNSIFVPSQAVADGVAVTVAGPFVAPTSVNASYADIGAETDAFLTKAVLTSRGFVYEDGTDIALTTGSGSGSLPFPVVTATQQFIENEFDEPTEFETQIRDDWSPAGSAAVTIDNTKLLPSYTADPVYDVTSNAESIAIAPSSNNVSADGANASMEFVRAAGSGSAEVDTTWDWFIVGPGPASVTFPTLPTDVFDFTPTATDTATVESYETLTFPGGYDAYRTNPFGFLESAFLTAAPTGSFQTSDASFGDQQGGDVRSRIAKHQVSSHMSAAGHRALKHAPAHKLVVRK